MNQERIIDKARWVSPFIGYGDAYIDTLTHKDGSVDLIFLFQSDFDGKLNDAELRLTRKQKQDLIKSLQDGDEEWIKLNS